MKKHTSQQGFGPLVIIIIAAIVLALSGGVYYSVKKNHQNVQTSNEASTTLQSGTSSTTSTGVNVTAGGQISGTLRDLLALGKNSVCTVHGTNGNNTVDGTLYVSGTNMRGDFTMKENTSETIESHVIRNGDTAYAWSGSQGAMMSVSSLMNMHATSSASAKTNVDLDQKVNYSCKDWTPDTSKFIIPTTVHFYDVSAIMKANATSGINIKRLYK